MEVIFSDEVATMTKGFGIFFILAGVALGVFSAFNAFQTADGLHLREKHSGTVVESDRDPADVLYKDAEGMEKRVHLDSGSHNQFKMGSQIDFFFYPDSKDFATPDNFLNLYLLEFIGAVIGFILLLTGIFLVLGRLALMGFIYCSAGVLLMGFWGFSLIKDEITLQTSGKLITGHVVNVFFKKEKLNQSREEERKWGEKTTDVRYLKISYSGPENETLYTTESGQWNKYKEGDEVPLVADFSATPKATIRGGENLMLYLIVFGFFTLVLVVLSLVFLAILRGKIKLQGNSENQES